MEDGKYMQKTYDRKVYLKGSFTVEMSFLMPMILFLIMGCILAAFYYHDKNVIASAAYETAVVGSTKAREKDGVSESELKRLFSERVGRKCILFSGAKASCTVTDEKIQIEATARKKRMSLSVKSEAAITKPEKHIRDMRRIKKLGKKVNGRGREDMKKLGIKTRGGI